jgi:hypothetical protein
MKPEISQSSLKLWGKAESAHFSPRLLSDVRYLPALKGKRGELRALRFLSRSARQLILPMIDVPPPSLDTTDLDQHLETFAGALAKGWRSSQPVLVDLFDLPQSLRCTGNRHPVSEVWRLLSERQVMGVPVTGFDRDQPYERAIAKVIAQAGSVAIRLLKTDIADPELADGAIASLLKSLRVPCTNAIVILDWRQIHLEELTALAESGAALLRRLSKRKFALVAAVASGIPQSLAQLGKNEVTRFPRLEKRLFERILGLSPSVPVVFGDYAIVHPDFVTPPDPQKMSPPAKIRRTTKNWWLIVKGGKFRDNPGQYFNLAALITGHPDYAKGEAWGDSYLTQCQARLISPGNLESWVAADTSHHLEFTASECANRNVA